MENQKAKILIVDDEPDIVEALKHFFSAKGYKAIGAFSGEKALGILEKERVDLVLLDIRMPGLQGTEVAKIIKDRYPYIKLIVITAYPEEGKRLARDTVLDGLFIKPVGVQELYSKLLDILAQKESPKVDLKSTQGIKARVFLIQAKLLFVESSVPIYNFLNAHFKRLFHRGENYELDVAYKQDEVAQKLMQFSPDILIFNLRYLNTLDVDFIEKISQSPYKPKEIIIYNLGASGNFERRELERLTKTVQAFCLKNGLIEIKWVEI